MNYVKRRYYDLRQGWVTFAPLFAYSNFVLIVYNFTGIRDYLSQEYFIGLFSIGAIVILLIIGNTFRKKQLSTDLSLAYERNPANATTFRLQLEATILILKNLDLPIPAELEKRIEYLKKIESGKI